MSISVPEFKSAIGEGLVMKPFQKHSTALLLIARNFPVLIGLLLYTSAATADIAYSNFGPNDSVLNGGFYAVGNRHSNEFPNIHRAARFHSAASGYIDQIDLSARLSNPGIPAADSLELIVWSNHIWSDGENTFHTPDEALWSGSISVDSFEAQLYSVQLESATRPYINEGETYWLSARAANGVNEYGWSINDQGIIGLQQQDNFGGENWSLNTGQGGINPAFRVTVVPEPNLFVVAVVGLLTVFQIRKRPCHR